MKGKLSKAWAAGCALAAAAVLVACGSSNDNNGGGGNAAKAAETKLTDKPLTGRYRTAIDRNIRGGFSISRADVAHHMLACLDQPETIGHTVGVST